MLNYAGEAGVAGDAQTSGQLIAVLSETVVHFRVVYLGAWTGHRHPDASQRH